VDSKCCADEVSKGNKDFGNWTRGHLYNILAKNLSIFCLCPETLWEAVFKGDGKIKLAEDISRQHRIQGIADCFIVRIRSRKQSGKI
jgi:hypothetical protein